MSLKPSPRMARPAAGGWAWRRHQVPEAGAVLPELLVAAGDAAVGLAGVVPVDGEGEVAAAIGGAAGDGDRPLSP